MSFFDDVSDPMFVFAVVAGVASVLVTLTLVGLAVAICGWGGTRAAMIVAGLVTLLGVGCLVLIVLTAQWLWWICVPAIYAGWLGFTTWRSRAEPVRRKPFHFSLSGMLMFVLIVALITGGVTVQRRQQQVEEQLVAQLGRHSGSSVYQTNFGRPSMVIISPNDDEELAEIVDILKGFADLRVVQVNGGVNLQPGAVAKLAELTGLRSLLMQHLRVSNADLAPLARLQKLELLELEAAGLTDAGLAQLYPLKRLRKLWLYHSDPTQITPQGLQRLHDELPKWDN